MSASHPNGDESGDSKVKKNPWKWFSLALVGALLLAGGVAIGLSVARNSPSDAVQGSAQSLNSSSPLPATMPDLFGMTAEEASNQVFMKTGLRSYGYGFPGALVTGQSIAPGQAINGNTYVVMYTTQTPVSEQPATIAHESRYTGVNLEAPMTGPYDATFKTASKLWLRDKNGIGASSFCKMTQGIMANTADQVRSVDPSKSNQLSLNATLAEQACSDVSERYGSGRWPGIPG
jgi:hypothetical protein